MREAACVALALCACGGGGDGGGAADATPGDAGTPDAVCTLSPGHAYVLTHERLLPSDEGGFDLDGDGVADNGFGALPSSTLTAADEGLNGQFLSGEVLVTFYLTSFDPPAADDQDVSLHVFHVLDADVPPDPANNLGGEGRFVLPDDQLDLSCHSLTEATATDMAGLEITAEKDRWRFPVTSTTGAIEWMSAVLVLTLDADFQGATGRLGAIMPFCSLSGVPFPGATAGTLLDALINDPSLSESVEPDMDRDGDGLEKVVGDGVSVSHCLDGDGSRIDGYQCPCDPRIADGYSMAVAFEVAPAVIVGVVSL